MHCDPLAHDLFLYKTRVEINNESGANQLTSWLFNSTDNRKPCLFANYISVHNAAINYTLVPCISIYFLKTGIGMHLNVIF